MAVRSGARLLLAALLAAALAAGADGGGGGSGGAAAAAAGDAEEPVGIRAAPEDKTLEDKDEDKNEKPAALLRRARAVPVGFDILGHYLRYDEMWAFLVDLVHRHPYTASLGTVGFTTEGRRIPVVRISTALRPNARRPVILIDAGIHAREWIGPAMGLFLIQQLLENPKNRELIAAVDWHIIPLLNPDGYEYTHTTGVDWESLQLSVDVEAYNNDRMWRKTRSYNPANACLGVDPNRNFDYNWGVVGVSWDSCKEIYAGPRPFSEPETRALRDYGLAHRNRIKLYVSIHSYGGYAIYPWGYTFTKPVDFEDLHAVGNLVKDAVLDAGIQKFSVGNCAELLGDVAAGGSDDWFKAVVGVKYSYTIEMPTDGFVTPEEEIADYVVPMFEGFRAFGTFIREMYGQRRVGRSPQPQPEPEPEPRAEDPPAAGTPRARRALAPAA